MLVSSIPDGKSMILWRLSLDFTGGVKLSYLTFLLLYFTLPYSTLVRYTTIHPFFPFQLERHSVAA